MVPGKEYSLESFNLLEGNEIQIHDEFVINDVNVTNQDVPTQNVRPPKRLKISDTDEAQPSVQSPQETGLLTVKGNMDFEPSHEKIQIASAPQPMDEDDLTLDELNNALGPNWYEKRDELVKHLHELLSSGELPKEHICYKFLKDVIGSIHCMALQGKRQQVRWAWNKDVKEFLCPVRKIGKKRVLCMLRGPGNAGKGRWSDFDINSFNIPIPSLDSVSWDRQKSYTPRSGIITEILKAFLKMAMKHAIHATHVYETRVNSVKVFVRNVDKKKNDECCRRGFVSIDPAMRPCSHCLEKGRQCRKVVVYINSSDCGSNYEKSMQIRNELRDTGQVELTLQHLCSMPDIIHVVKSLSCSLTNWYLIVEGCRVNSSLLCVIQETEPLGTQMRRVLSLEAVKQRDRMRSQTPRELSNSNVWDLFTCKHVCDSCKSLPNDSKCLCCREESHNNKFCQEYVVSPLVPEKWRLSEDNKEGCITQPHCICRGPPSTFFVCNKTTIYSLRLHYPVQVKTVLQSLSCISCISYNDGIILISQLDVGKVTFYDYLFKLTPKMPSRKEELQEYLRERDVPFASQSNVKELRAKAKEYIRCHQKRDSVLMCIEGVTAMNFYAPDLVYLASTSWNAIAEVSLRCKAFTIEASILRRFPFPQGEPCFPGSVCLVDSMLFYSNLTGDGISALDLVSGEHSVVLKGGESSSPHGLVALQDSIFFSDRKARQIKVLHRRRDSGEAVVDVFAGNGTAQRKYSLANMASFGQPSSVVAEGNSLFLCDTGAHAISLITSIKALHSATKQFGQLYDAFGVRCDEKNIEATSALRIVDNSVQFHRKCVAEIKEFFELPQDKCLDGSFGAPSKETIDSLEMIGEVLRETIFDPSVPEPSEVKLLSKALTTKVNEHLFAKARELGLNEAVGCLDFAINFPSIVEEVMKRITKLPFLFYTHPESYYEIPQVFIKFEDMPSIPKPNHVTLPAQDIVKLNDYRKSGLKLCVCQPFVAIRPSIHFQHCPSDCTNQSHLRMWILTSWLSFVEERTATCKLQGRK